MHFQQVTNSGFDCGLSACRPCAQAVGAAQSPNQQGLTPLDIALIASSGDDAALALVMDGLADLSLAMEPPLGKLPPPHSNP